MYSSFSRLGFIQGRLSPLVEGKIQAFPFENWQEEFSQAEAIQLNKLEWTLDQATLYENPLLTLEGQKIISRLCSVHNITIATITGDCFMQAPFWQVRRSLQKALLNDAKQIIISAASIGARIIVIPLVDNGSLRSQAQINALKYGMQDLAPLLQKHQVQIAFESDMPPKELAAFIEDYPSKLFGINYDIGNSAAFGYDCVREIGTYGTRIIGVHVKDRLLGGTTVPLGEGNADIPLCIQTLENSGYNGLYVLQTARATDDDHVGALLKYRDMTARLLARNS